MSSAKFLTFFLVTSLSVFYLSSKLFPKRSASPNVPVIKSPAGQIRGTELTTKYGRSISAYRAIPYAEPPITELRYL